MGVELGPSPTLPGYTALQRRKPTLTRIKIEMSENRVLKRIFGPNKEEQDKGEKSHNDEVCNFHCEYDILVRKLTVDHV
jgi:hypothetical protein